MKNEKYHQLHFTEGEKQVIWGISKWLSDHIQTIVSRKLKQGTQDHCV